MTRVAPWPARSRTGDVPTTSTRSAASLPETELGISWGDRPTWKVPRGPKGKGFLLYRAPHKTAIDPDTGEMYDDLLVIITPDRGREAALVEDDATPFFTIAHFNGFNAVLVQQSRLGELDPRRAGRGHHRRLGRQAPKRLVEGAPLAGEARRDRATRAAACDVLRGGPGRRRLRQPRAARGACASTG